MSVQEAAVPGFCIKKHYDDLNLASKMGCSLFSNLLGEDGEATRGQIRPFCVCGQGTFLLLARNSELEFSPLPNPGIPPDFV